MRLAKELWEYREMVISLVKRDLKSRYKGSVLGFFWMFLNPLLQLAVYTVVFSTILRAGIEQFYLFLFVALVPWIFFNTCLSAGTTVIFSQQDMVKKIYFPREALPLSFTISQFINMLLSFAVIFLVVLLSGRGLHLRALAFLPLVMAAEFLLALGTVYFVSALNVYFRDLEHILGIVSMAWMYLTPVLYSLDMVPQQYVGLYYFNPMTAVIISYRKILYDGVPPHMDTLLGSLAVGAAVLLAGQAAFGRLQRHFAEEL